MKKRDLDEAIDKIRDGLSCLDQGSIFSSVVPGYAEIEKACVDYLKILGYGIRPPYKFPAQIKKLDDLINLFYDLYFKKFPGTIPYGGKSESEERKTASRFIQSRIDASGLDKHTAMQECGEIIRTVFENLDGFNFTVPITFGIFGQKNMGWVTDVAVEIMNRKIEEYKRIEDEAWADKIMAERSKTHRAGWTEEELDKALKNLEGEGNGKS